MLKTLLIDDYPESCSHFIPALKNDFEVELYSSTNLENIPLDNDIYLVDIHLPYISGDLLIKYLRERGVQKATYVLITADESDTAVYNYYKDYVDDILSKSMSPLEISKKIHVAYNRKQKLLNNQILTNNEIKIDTQNCFVYVCDKLIDLTFVEYKILLTVIRNPIGISKEDLMYLVWPNITIDKKTVNTHIGNLNRKIIDSGKKIKIDRKGKVFCE